MVCILGFTRQMASVSTTYVFSFGTKEAPDNAMQHTKQERLCKEATVLAVNAKTATSRENTFSKC